MENLLQLALLDQECLLHLFLFVGDSITNVANNGPDGIYNFRIVFYSLSSIFYLFLSYIFLCKINKILRTNVSKYLILLIFGGSGIAYFAFERFSMTHVYEVFTTSLVIFLTCKYYQEKGSKIYAILIPIALNLAFLVRLSNYYVFLLPLVTKLLYLKKLT